MPEPTQSYLKVPYDVRTAKQVERRMMLDALQILSRSGFDIGEYQYTGFGSIFFVDFILLHRYLGMTRLLSVEYDQTIRKRVEFNKPFDLIRLQFRPASEVIPTLSRDVRHVLWLDYDDYLRDGMLRDVQAALTQLSVGSLFFVTVDVEPPVKCGRPRDWYEYFEHEAGEYFDPTWTVADFTLSNLPSINRNVLRAAMASALAYREEVELLPLFSMLYADGHQMYTVGGMIGSAKEKRDLRHCDFDNAPYIRRSLDIDPYVIRVPNVTKRERAFLDAAMPCATGWVPDVFEISRDDVGAFREIYRFLPNYVEAF